MTLPRLLLIVALAPLAWLAAPSSNRRRGDQAALGRLSKRMNRVHTAFDRMSAALATRERERDRAEAAQRAGEARLAHLLALTPAGVVELDVRGRFTYGNATAERVLGAKPGGFVGRHYLDPSWQAAAQDGTPIPPDRLPVAWALRGETIKDYEHIVVALDGRRVVLLVDLVPVRGENGQIEGALGAFQDVTTRHAAVQALNESELRFRSFVENSTDVLWIVDVEAGRLEYLSPSYEQVWGEPRERVMQDLNRWSATVHPDDRARTSESLPRVLAGETHGIEYTDRATRRLHSLDARHRLPNAGGKRAHSAHRRHCPGRDRTEDGRASARRERGAVPPHGRQCACAHLDDQRGRSGHLC